MKGRQIWATALALGVLAAPVAALAQFNPGAWFGYGNNGYQGSRQTSGTIASVNGGDVRLTNGRNIFLENGTVINPRGTSLQAGQRISVVGAPGGNGAINASEIDVNGYGGYGGYGNGQGYGNGNGRWDRDDRNGRWDRDDRRARPDRDDRRRRWDRDDRNRQGNHDRDDRHRPNDPDHDGN